MFCLLEFRGASASSFPAVSGAFYFFGGIAMNVAGIWEFILGNTFPGTIFFIFGCHWAQTGYVYDPANNVAGSFTAGGLPGALNKSYNSGSAMYDVTCK